MCSRPWRRVGMQRCGWNVCDEVVVEAATWTDRRAGDAANGGPSRSSGMVKGLIPHVFSCSGRHMAGGSCVAMSWQSRAWYEYGHGRKGRPPAGVGG